MKRNANLLFVAIVLAASANALRIEQTPPTWLPNIAITPGAVDPRLTDAVLRAPGFTTKTYRPPTRFTDRLKREALRLYGLDAGVNPDLYELDHEIPISIGGATDILNLWPEPWSVNVGGYDEGAHVKDRLEDWLALQVKRGKMSGAQARSLIVGDWTVEYLKVFKAFPRFK
jgi:hypothetical protein